MEVERTARLARLVRSHLAFALRCDAEAAPKPSTLLIRVGEHAR